MQLLGRDRIHQSFTDGNSTLHELCSGNFQLGSGDDATIVTAIDQIETFAPIIKAKVQTWLDAGGVNKAQIEKRDLIMAEQASKQPGTIDAMLDQLNDPTLKGQIAEMLAEALEKKQSAPPRDVLAEVDGGVIVKAENGSKEFIPNDDEMDRVMKAELALDGKQDEEPSLVTVGGGDEAEDDSVAGQIAQSTHSATKAAQRQASKAKARR